MKKFILFSALGMAAWTGLLVQPAAKPVLDAVFPAQYPAEVLGVLYVVVIGLAIKWVFFRHDNSRATKPRFKR